MSLNNNPITKIQAKNQLFEVLIVCLINAALSNAGSKDLKFVSTRRGRYHVMLDAGALVRIPVRSKEGLRSAIEMYNKYTRAPMDGYSLVREFIKDQVAKHKKNIYTYADAWEYAEASAYKVLFDLEREQEAKDLSCLL